MHIADDGLSCLPSSVTSDNLSDLRRHGIRVCQFGRMSLIRDKGSHANVADLPIGEIMQGVWRRS
jgi:hypothetical protein